MPQHALSVSRPIRYFFVAQPQPFPQPHVSLQLQGASHTQRSAVPAQPQSVAWQRHWVAVSFVFGIWSLLESKRLIAPSSKTTHRRADHYSRDEKPNDPEQQRARRRRSAGRLQFDRTTRSGSSMTDTPRSEHAHVRARKNAESLPTTSHHSRDLEPEPPGARESPSKSTRRIVGSTNHVLRASGRPTPSCTEMLGNSSTAEAWDIRTSTPSPATLRLRTWMGWPRCRLGCARTCRRRTGSSAWRTPKRSPGRTPP